MSLNRKRPDGSQLCGQQKGLSENLSLLVAICAIVVSMASFYVAYIQANAAEQQVKAMTWPLIQFSHGNYDVEKQERELTFQLTNAGVGPAIIHNVRFNYGGSSLPSLAHYLEACCEQAQKTYLERALTPGLDSSLWTLTTSPVNDIILPVGGEVDFINLVYHEENAILWQALNKERWQLQLEVCYCSLLDSCYTTAGTGTINEVANCSTKSSP